ncbi:MAG: chorismate mutase [ANME-2 cluster archaeon]|nr:chorismate mutase [ANME-2 cluster archaeon]
MLSERSKYVRQAAKFKKNTDDVQAPKRVEEVIAKVRNLALEYGLNPEIIEQIYRTMIACFIEFEMKEHRK